MLCFPQKNNQPSLSFVAGIKNEDVVFLWQSQKNIASKKMTGVDEMDAAVQVSEGHVTEISLTGKARQKTCFLAES